MPKHPAAANFASWKAVQSDAKALAAGQDPQALPLWPGSPPGWFTENDTNPRAIWAQDPDTWSFWTRWWDGFLSGKQLDWNLQHQVALIAMLPSRDHHWRAAYVLIALGIPLLGWLTYAGGALWGLAFLAAGASLLRWPLIYLWRWLRRS